MKRLPATPIAPNRSGPKRVAILGGGITGLSAALRLQASDSAIEWRLFEAAPRLGGVLQTIEQDGYRVEQSADNFLTRDPWATDLAAQVGLADELLPTDPARRRALVVHNGKVTRVPEGFVLMAPQQVWPILTSPILSLAGKARLAAEPLAAARRDLNDESVGSFARRRLGRQAFERLVQPLVGGIYTADPDRLSMQATLPQFVEQERKFGSIVRAALSQGKSSKRSASERRESGARYGLFVAPRLGMEQLVEAIVAKLPPDRRQVGRRVDRVEPTPAGWIVAVEGEREESMFDAVIVALPSAAASMVLAGANALLSSALAGIEYAGCSVVCLGVHASQITRPIDGFGFVVPAIEKRRLIAASCASYKFPGRAPAERVLLRGFVGGALQPALADADDATLVRSVQEELADLIGLRGDPELTMVARWPQRMPQYHVGHLDRIAEIERLAASQPGLELAGAAYRGVGVPQCIHSGESAADRVLKYVGASPLS